MRVSGPVTGGSKGWAFGGPTADLAALGYRQDEYFLEGEAARYGPAPGTELGAGRAVAGRAGGDARRTRPAWWSCVRSTPRHSTGR